MGKSKVPDPLTRRHLLEGKLDPAKALRFAEAYLEQERLIESLDFLCAAGETERLEALRRDAVAAGDAFLFRAIVHALGAEPRMDEWETLAEAAAAAGKESHASDARRQAERGED